MYEENLSLLLLNGKSNKCLIYLWLESGDWVHMDAGLQTILLSNVKNHTSTGFRPCWLTYCPLNRSVAYAHLREIRNRISYARPDEKKTPRFPFSIRPFRVYKCSAAGWLKVWNKIEFGGKQYHIEKFPSSYINNYLTTWNSTNIVSYIVSYKHFFFLNNCLWTTKKEHVSSSTIKRWKMHCKRVLPLFTRLSLN